MNTEEYWVGVSHTYLYSVKEGIEAGTMSSMLQRKQPPHYQERLKLPPLNKVFMARQTKNLETIFTDILKDFILITTQNTNTS